MDYRTVFLSIDFQQQLLEEAVQHLTSGGPNPQWAIQVIDTINTIQEASLFSNHQVPNTRTTNLHNNSLESSPQQQASSEQQSSLNQHTNDQEVSSSDSEFSYYAKKPQASDKEPSDPGSSSSSDSDSSSSSSSTYTTKSKTKQKGLVQEESCFQIKENLLTTLH